MLKYKTVNLGIDCFSVSFCSQMFESSDPNITFCIFDLNIHTQYDAATGSDW